MRTLWKSPVTLIGIGEDGEDVVVDTTLGASWALIEDWPLEEGPVLDKALAVCAAVSNGKAKDEDARQALLAAALEAGVKVKT
ncbi:DUF982 domain-containing protein [Rhizobium sp. G187]|uniref:DUF982 domain-containing protein n=1 Tax=Rhizobium sp. G187 TaxID=3451352 RepID=UPI003EE76E1F